MNELIAAYQFASNRLVNVENITENEMKVIRKYYAQLSKITKSERILQTSHPIDEAANRSELKKNAADDVINRV